MYAFHPAGRALYGGRAARCHHRPQPGLYTAVRSLGVDLGGGSQAAFWAGGRLVTWPLLRTVGRGMQRPLLEPRYDDERLFGPLLVGRPGPEHLRCSSPLLLSMGGIAALGTDAFTTAYGSGFTGHLLVVTQLLLVFWIGSLRKLRMGDLLRHWARCWLSRCSIRARGR